MSVRPFSRCLLVLALLVLATVGARAAELPSQLNQPPEALADDFLKGLSQRLALTPQETTALRPILVDQARKRQDLARTHLAGNPGRAEMLALREALQALGQEADIKLAAVLPPDKMTVVRAYQAERRQELRARLEQRRKGG